MRVVSQLVPGVVAFLVAFGAAADAQMQYTVNGKPVNASTYQAFKLVNESVALMKQNRIADATTKLRTALNLDPEFFEARVMMGMAEARAGHIDEAIEQMRMGLADMPTSDSSGESRKIVAQINLGGLFLSAGRAQDAVDLYNKILAEQPDTKSAAVLRERVALLQREIDRQKQARAEHREDSYDQSNYYTNVIGDGRRRWPASSMPIRIYVYSGASLDGWKPEYDQILRDSFKEWSDASNGRISFAFVKSPRDADVTCNWIEDPALLGSSAEAGEAQVVSRREAISGCKMVLSLNDAGSAFPLTPNLVRLLCLHEIGHALGLVGHSARAGDVMYCSMPVVDRPVHLSSRDRATINALYDHDVDSVSNLLADLDKRTNGNSENLIRAAILMVTVIVAAIIGGIAISRKQNKKRKRKK